MTAKGGTDAGIGFLRTLFSDEVAKILLVKAFFIDAADEAGTRGFKINRCGAGLQQSAVIHRILWLFRSYKTKSPGVRAAFRTTYSDAEVPLENPVTSSCFWRCKFSVT